MTAVMTAGLPADMAAGGSIRAVALRGVCAAYGAHPVLEGVDLSLGPGECAALLGPNGSGKTTLLRCADGTLAPWAGTACLHGREAAALRPRERARLVAVVAQQSGLVSRPAGLSVLETVLLGRYPWLSWSGTYARRDYEAAERALEATGAMALARRPVQTLSGGEWQRVLLARALAQLDGCEEPVFVLDELAASLDPARAVELFSLLEARRRQGACLLMAVHDCNLAARCATRLIGLRQGRVLFDGPVRSVFTEENLSALYAFPLCVFSHPDADLPQALPALSRPGTDDDGAPGAGSSAVLPAALHAVHGNAGRGAAGSH